MRFAGCPYHQADIIDVCRLATGAVRAPGLDLAGSLGASAISLGIEDIAVRDAASSMLRQPTIVSREQRQYVQQPDWACAMKMQRIAECPIVWAEDL